MGILAYTRSPQIQSLDSRTKAWRETMEVNGPREGVLAWWVKISFSVKRIQPGIRLRFPV